MHRHLPQLRSPQKKSSLFVKLFAEFEVHEKVAERAVDVTAVALNGRVARRVDQVDGDGVGIDDIVGRV